MDLTKAIAELREEKRRLDETIEALERAAAGGGGRKGRVWNSQARRAAAERMRSYWAKRRGETPATTPQSPPAPSPES